MLSFNQIVERMLAHPNLARMDRREGSIIYDAVSLCAMEIYLVYQELLERDKQGYLLTATGDFLALRASDFGESRKPATYAERIVETTNTSGNPFNALLGSRYQSEDGRVSFRLTEHLSTGVAVIVAEQAGSVGNEPYGRLIPLVTVPQLSTIEITDTRSPAQDVETDDAFRERVVARIKQEAFAGNIPAYEQLTKSINGVGNVIVFPAERGHGGEVLLAVIGADFNPISDTFKQQLKEVIDPDVRNLTGVGYAPIGHTVFISTPDELDITVAADITINTGLISKTQAQPLIEQQIREYLLDVRSRWGEPNLTLFSADIIVRVKQIQGIMNIDNVKFNGVDQKLALINDRYIQQTPKYQATEITWRTA